MKFLHLFFVTFCTLMLGGTITNASWWPNPDPEVIICQGTECSLEGGTTAAANTIDGIITDRTLSEYVIQLIQYLVTFVTLIGVIIVIYAGFTILVSGGDEEKTKKAKKLILYSVLGILLIWLAWAIMNFFVLVLTTDPV